VAVMPRLKRFDGFFIVQESWLGSGLVRGIRPFEHASSRWKALTHATVAMRGRILVTLDRNCGEAFRPFDPLNLAGSGSSRITGVNLQGSKQFAIPGDNTFRTERVQTK